MLCDFCMKDYASQFGEVIHCFGCGKTTRGGISLPATKTKTTAVKPLNYDLYPLTRGELTWVKGKWGISKTQAEDYGLGAAINLRRGRFKYPGRYLYFPIYDEYGKLVHGQFRGLTEDCTVKYMTYDNPAPDTMWFSKQFRTTDPEKIVVVEGVADGIRVANVCHTVALLGTDLNHEKVTRILSVAKPDTRFILMLDEDAVLKSLTFQQSLGIIRTKVAVLPSGDPTDYTDAELRRFVGG